MASEITGSGSGTLTFTGASMKIKVIGHNDAGLVSDTTGFGDALAQRSTGKRQITLDMEGIMLSGVCPVFGASATVSILNMLYKVSCTSGKIISVSNRLNNDGPWEGRVTIAVNAIGA